MPPARRSSPACSKAEHIAGGKLLVVADPKISEARKEVAFLAKLYPGRHQVVSDVMRDGPQVQDCRLQPAPLLRARQV